MARIGITGHMNLSADSVPLVYEAIRKELTSRADEELTGLSCIARGADSIFARAILDMGGELEVILPSTTYRETKVKPDHARLFDELLERATDVYIMPFETANREAYEAANEKLVFNSDILFAVWDGQSSADRGGTGAVVEFARSRDVQVKVIWPDGVSKD